MITKQKYHFQLSVQYCSLSNYQLVTPVSINHKFWFIITAESIAWLDLYLFYLIFIGSMMVVHILKITLEISVHTEFP
jgi:hypothetical protein